MLVLLLLQKLLIPTKFTSVHPIVFVPLKYKQFLKWISFENDQILQSLVSRSMFSG